jgi:hypothetical protein
MRNTGTSQALSADLLILIVMRLVILVAAKKKGLSGIFD